MRTFHAADRSMRFQLAALSIVALVAAGALSLVSILYTHQVVQDELAAVIATVSQKYPQAEAEVVRDIRRPNPEAIAQGREILRRYDLEAMGVQDNAITRSLAGRILPGSLLYALCLPAAFTLLLLRYRRYLSVQITELSRYLQRLDQGDYDLDIRDNGEGAFSILKNDLYKITVRLREQAELLKKDKVYLADAIADISHQIKTPLTSLFVLVDLLAEFPPEADQRKFIARINSQLGRIQWLISSLLKLSRLDAGTANLKREPVNLQRLVEQSIESLQIPIELKNLQLEFRGDPGASYLGDFLWSVEAITNLVKNCVEHTPQGGRIEITYGENPLYVEITVADNGEGIASEDLPLIFTRFYRGKNASENSVGIGLALAKAIFIEQGGDISVRSEPGQGTNFYARVFRGTV